MFAPFSRSAHADRSVFLAFTAVGLPVHELATDLNQSAIVSCILQTLCFLYLNITFGIG